MLGEEPIETSENVLFHKLGESFGEFVLLCSIYNLHIYYIYLLDIQISCFKNGELMVVDQREASN